MIQNGIQIMNNYAYNLIIHCYQQSYIEWAMLKYIKVLEIINEVDEVLSLW